MNTIQLLNKLKTVSLISLKQSNSNFEQEILKICGKKQITSDNHNLHTVSFDDKEVTFCTDKDFDDDKLEEVIDIIEYTGNAYSRHIRDHKLAPIVLISNVKDSSLPEKHRNSIHGRVGYTEPFNFIHFISTQCLAGAKWMTRHEAVHIADHLLGITNAPSSTPPKVVDNNETGVKAVWDMVRTEKRVYCEQNPQEQLVVDVLRQKYNIPADIMLNLAHGVYRDFYQASLWVLESIEGSKKQFKQEVREFVKEHVLPKGYPDYYVDILKIFKSKNSWMV